MSTKTDFNRLLSSEEWIGYIHSLERAIGLPISIYDEKATLLMPALSPSPLCNTASPSSLCGKECAEFYNKLIWDSVTSKEPVISQCQSKITSVAIPIDYKEEKAVIVCTIGFSSYEDFTEFLKIAHTLRTYDMPITEPLNFIERERVSLIAEFLFRAVNGWIKKVEERSKISEDVARLTKVFDISALSKLSENRELVYRYITDTAHFLISPATVFLMVLDPMTSGYKTAYSTGTYKDAVMDFKLAEDSLVIREVISSKEKLLTLEFEKIRSEAEKYIQPDYIQEIKSFYLLPIFIGGNLEGMIWVLDKKLADNGSKIISAFRDYIEVALENQALKLSADKKIDKILSFFSDLSRSIAPILNHESLMQTILEKSTQLLKAEQGSLMLLNADTSELLIEAEKGIKDILAEEIRLRKGEGLSGKVLESGEPLLVEDIETDPRIKQKNRPRYKTGSFMIVPLRIEDRIAGVLNISDKSTGDVFTENDMKLLNSFTASAAIAIERSVFYKENEELRRISVTDPLTNIYNRRYMTQRLTEEIIRFNRYKQSFSFIMIDIDGFKKYNDTFGHVTGDKALKLVANTLSQGLRSIDIAARFGGDEFAIILPQTPKVDAVNIAERLRENIAIAPLLKEAGLPVGEMTISLGLASYPDDASSMSELIEKTDQALYLAKKSGGNKLVHL
ncbi:MAG: diguanylate cyclase [Nitrospirae bacterium]|nr:diguanylate cyclase [Nitrospirota bacterium]